MEIKPDSSRINDDDITVFFTLTDGENVFKWHCDIPTMPEEEIQAYLETKIEEYRCGIYYKQYRDAVVEKQQEETDLMAWKRWVAGGCMNGDNTIPPARWKDTHTS